MMFTSGGQPDLWRTMAHGGGKGGGSYNAPANLPPTVLTDPVTGKSFTQAADDNSTTAQDQLNAEIAQRQADAQATSDAATATANQTAATNESNFQATKTAAYNNALQSIMRAFQVQGLDPQKYMQSDILPALATQQNTIADLSPNPQAAYPTDLGSTIIGNLTSGARTTAGNALNSTFTPTYAQTAIPDSLITDNLGGIISSQFDPLQAQLTNAQKRGTLSQPGYDAAEALLNTKKNAATATLQNLGQGILSTDRTNLNSYISGAKTDANNITLGQNFDPTQYTTGAQNQAQGDISSFGGALTNAVGDTQFANISDLINAGGATQGVQNPTASNPAGAPTTASNGGALSPAYVPDAVADAQKRGLGNTGAF